MMESRWHEPGPKAILSLDGGGVRGAFSIGVLEVIEEKLKLRNPGETLASYFDFVAGTSTGAIIAAAIGSLGFSAKELRSFYLEDSKKIFRKRNSLLSAVLPSFDSRPLRKKLGAEFGERTLGEADAATGFGIVCRRVDVPSTWFFHNHPAGMQIFSSGPQSFSRGRIQGHDVRLVEVVRASTAAPFYFAPQKLKLPGVDNGGIFIDGALTGFNSPALKALKFVSEIPKWGMIDQPIGIVSIGTGSLTRAPADEPVSFSGKLFGLTPAGKALQALMSMITTTEDMADETLTFISNYSYKLHRPVYADQSSKEFDGSDFEEPQIMGFIGKNVGYVRLNVRLRQDWIREICGISLSRDQVETLRDMTDPAAASIAYDVGRAYGERTIRTSILAELKSLR